MAFVLSDRQYQAAALLNGPQRNTLLVGGARSSKTTLIVRNIVMRAIKAPGSRHIVLRFRQVHVKRSINMDTFPKTMEMCFPQVPFTEHKQDSYFRLYNGSEIWTSGLDEKERVDQILGLEYSTIFLNECSQIPYNSVLVVKTRLAQVAIQKYRGRGSAQQNGKPLMQRMYYDLNPTGTGHYTYKLFIEHRDPETLRAISDPEQYAHMFLSPLDNIHNLDQSFIDELAGLPEKQRKRFYEGVYVPEVVGALWTIETIDRCRMGPTDPIPHMTRVVVAVDPSGTSGDEDERSDEVGIVVAGLGIDGVAYILADRSCKLAPAGWGREVIKAVWEFRADLVVAEINFGGEMVRFVVQSAAKDAQMTIRVKRISASRGKVVRAEPISAHYEAGRVRHTGTFDRLEEQMMNMSTAGYQGHRSPDRLDAAVWGLSELLIKQPPPWARSPGAQKRPVGPIAIYAAR